MSDEEAYLLGTFLGDGCLSRAGGKYMVYLCGHKFDDLHHFQNVLVPYIKAVWNKDVKIVERKSEKTIVVRFSDKQIFERLVEQEISWKNKYEKLHIPPDIKDTPHIHSFVAGLFATDGCLVFSKQHKKEAYYPRIEITSKSRGFLEEVREVLQEGFYGSISKKGKNAYRLEFPGNKNVEKWADIIGFRNKKHQDKYYENYLKRP